MSKKILIFTPLKEKTMEANLEGFIELARKMNTFGDDLDFDADAWDVTDYVRLKRRNSKSRIVFRGFPSGRGFNDAKSLPQPFQDFAKAYCRYDYALSPYTTVSARLAALRALAVALEESEDCITPLRATLLHFDKACSIIEERYRTASAFMGAEELKRISRFLVQHQLCSLPTAWNHHLKSPEDKERRVGPTFDSNRLARLPSPESLSAIAEIFGVAQEPGDVFTSSICALLASAPSRINEVLSVSINCEVEEFDSKSDRLLYGLRWLPSKGGKPQVKWVVQSMASVAQEAVKKIRAISEPAREVAKWYEVNPDKLFLPPELETLRECQYLTSAQVGMIVFADPPLNGNNTRRGGDWCRKHNIPERCAYDPKCKDAPRFAFKDVELALTKIKPKGFPFLDRERRIKYSNALCLVRRNELNKMATYRSAIVLPDTGYIQTQLTGSPSVINIFDRFGYAEKDGGKMQITTHQFRHYLNTVAQMGGLSQLDVAKWSGRAKITHNKCYDHQSDRDVLALARSALGDPEKSAGHVPSIPVNSLVTRDQFAELQILTAHTTDLGYCLHDFSMLPCQLHRDCLSCNEHVCVKGDAVRERAIRQHRQETQSLLQQALKALGEEEFGANRWVEHQTLKLKRLDELCVILDDPSIPVDTVIRPSGVLPVSRLQQLIDPQHLAIQLGVLKKI
ncbi:integrase [Pseudomonas sp. Irchel 3E13]|jgi:hypothetical protein|uniref:integrase n=1 Tax=Pseudomonas sp. Irchel 3E13 TaxID=2008975 RepID=UPI00117A6D61|nr:integrase [Pseudomonas sp. Irchel 3E13]